MSRSTATRQLALDLPHTAGAGLEDFLPADCNRQALDAVLRWPDWPTPALLIVGPRASGKTHLLRVWAQRSGAAVLAAAEIWDEADPWRRLAVDSSAAVDDADQVEDERLLFHLFTRVAGQSSALLLTAAHSPSAWPIVLPDLRSRLRASWTVRIEPPDDALLAALLVKQLADRQLRVEAEVVHYLVARMERSFAAVRALAAALDRASLRARRPVTLGLARAVLAELETANDANEEAA